MKLTTEYCKGLPKKIKYCQISKGRQSFELKLNLKKAKNQ